MQMRLPKGILTKMADAQKISKAGITARLKRGHEPTVKLLEDLLTQYIAEKEKEKQLAQKVEELKQRFRNNGLS